MVNATVQLATPLVFIWNHKKRTTSTIFSFVMNLFLKKVNILNKIRILVICLGQKLTYTLYKLEGLQSLHELLQSLHELLFYNNQSVSNLGIVECLMLSEDGLGTLNSVEVLIILYCPKLKSIENLSRRAKKYQGILHELRIEGCEKLMEFPC